MKKIGLISDTHGFLHPSVRKHFSNCDEIWHAGDIGSLTIIDQLVEICPVRAVYGNIDGHEVRSEFPKHLRFSMEGVDTWITHIGGYPGHYDRRVFEEINHNPPDLFICGHSHILKAIPDQKLGLLHLNPGAAGKIGFHQVITLMRFDINDGKVEHLEVIELQKRI